MGILVAIVVLGVLIFVHELGHFLVAKYFGIGVMEFSIGFGGLIYGKKVGDTFYSVRAIPLGGYVRLAGEDRSIRTVEDLEKSEDIAEEEKEYLKRIGEDRWFYNRGFWQKFLVVLAGPVFNILFGYLVTVINYGVWGLFTFVDKPIVGAVVPGMPAERAGIKKGDRILKVDNVKIRSWSELPIIVGEKNNKPLKLLIERIDENGRKKILHIKVKPELDKSDISAIVGEDKVPRYRIGILASKEPRPIPFFDAFKYAGIAVYAVARNSIFGLIGLISGKVSLKVVGGPITIVSQTAQSAKSSISDLLEITLIISVMLAIMNLLPIPILDGGHILIFIIEAIKG
ncbi:MAG: RIP metalloprotease, partial [Candidatus Dadabacteria bacterium]